MMISLIRIDQGNCLLCDFVITLFPEREKGGGNFQDTQITAAWSGLGGRVIQFFTQSHPVTISNWPISSQKKQFSICQDCLPRIARTFHSRAREMITLTAMPVFSQGKAKLAQSSGKGNRWQLWSVCAKWGIHAPCVVCTLCGIHLVWYTLECVDL